MSSAPTASNDRMVPLMGGEDFAFMLEARPGAFVFSAWATAMMPSPRLRFNDNILGHGASYWVRLVEKAMPARDNLRYFTTSAPRAVFSLYSSKNS